MPHFAHDLIYHTLRLNVPLTPQTLADIGQRCSYILMGSLMPSVSHWVRMLAATLYDQVAQQLLH